MGDFALVQLQIYPSLDMWTVVSLHFELIRSGMIRNSELIASWAISTWCLYLCPQSVFFFWAVWRSLAMDKNTFAKVVDESLHNLRWRLLDAFPEVVDKTPSGMSPTQSLNVSASPSGVASAGLRPKPDTSPRPGRNSLSPGVGSDDVQSMQSVREEHLEAEEQHTQRRNPELVPHFQVGRVT